MAVWQVVTPIIDIPCVEYVEMCHLSQYQEFMKNMVRIFGAPYRILLIKSKNSIGYSRYKVIIFVTGVILISFSEILTKFFSYDFNTSFLLMIVPVLISIIFYLLFYKQSLTSSK